jgi:hypothetical protein
MAGHTYLPVNLSRNLLRYFCRIVLAALLLAHLPAAALIAPKAVLWERWSVHDATSSVEIDHSAWTRFLAPLLETPADGINRLRYANVRGAKRKILDGYIAMLTATAISKYNREQQRAFWINLYNALTVQVVLDHYPVASILDIDISPGFLSFGPWDKKLTQVEGEPLSLNDIEHRILRPLWKDPRIHYALNCASVGCPNLMPKAFTPENAEALLDQGARSYVNHPRGVEFIGGKVVTSSIYYWFKEDFGGTDRGVLEHLRRYAAPDLRERLQSFTRLGGHSYNWALNDAKKTAIPDS